MPQMVLFQTGNMQFALDRNRISHIGPMIIGAGAVKGRIQQQSIEYMGQPDLLLIDLAAAMDTDAAVPQPSDTKLIMLKAPPTLALWADSVHGVITADTEQMDVLPPVFTGAARSCFPKILRLKDKLILVVDVVALVKFLQNTGPSAHQIWQKHAADKQAPFPTEKAAHSNQSPKRSDDNTLEAMIARKLQQIIGRRVKKIVAQTMAETLDRHRVHI